MQIREQVPVECSKLRESIGVLPVATPHTTPTIIENWTIEVRETVRIHHVRQTF